MKLNKQYIIVILIALIAMDNIATLNAISVERRREYRKQKSNVKWFWSGWFTSNSTKNKVLPKPAKPTKQKFFAFGKGMLIGLVLGVIYKLIGIGVEKAMGALFGPVDDAKPEADPKQPELLAKIDDIHKLVTGDTGGFTAGKWDEFPTTVGTTVTEEILGGTEPEVEVPKTLPTVADDGTAPEESGPKDKVATVKKTIDSNKLDQKAAAAAATIIDTTKAETAVANDPLAKNAQSGTLTDQQKKDFAKIVLLAQAQMKNVKAIAEKAATDVTAQKSSDKDILPAAKSLWGIAKDFGENLKSQIKTKDLWLGIAKNILIQVGVAAAIVGISILNPIAGAVAAAAWAAYKFIKDVYGLVKVILSCIREDGADENKNCGQNGIAAGMKVVSIVASFLLRKHHKKHHHKNHRLAHKIRQSRKLE